MIQLDNVSYTYEKGGGVSNVNLAIQDDEYAFLIGPTGSGKTTLLRLAYMDLFPKVGKVIIDKYDSSKIKQKKIPFFRRKIGMIFQDYHLLNDRNLFENIALPLHVIGFQKDEIVDRVTESLEEIGLESKSEHFPDELSGGEQQRACVARALVKDPDIILADEPTGNLDPVTSFELIKLLEEINREGTTILMASHNYNLIKGRGHRIIEIQNGIVRKS
ncbi:MAG: ATP-binding cassette domain-containing protein [Candidatus Marinimicrobia bacterium]|jgi:cell division transport system ATP-binding protein|nr:ATP-binding cassette domain-containing protein [Candidatus Neomarinimicrobiota bacterium]MBT4149428.1 ATP-binding cassette domain-containing protein [Candidatus Neomarinimicrobiota bacterium]MBT4318853.1 ATP-binding cassette domain-containing protein [Candidatus Neomarinimicrobiota bacterium]MBT4783710.1 ATP-binding cassette domain-containing protein [Candidatus Neomarinimicrobiota bacterium]MBT5096739.1 ATP-binding cassette domain-containing protein [Candidatus Neomarinimicrobiota bacterium|tara:strand:+ start:4972 stop:5625 length:654 start_codon:yes stop_codon:yes gene_type:complete